MSHFTRKTLLNIHLIQSVLHCQHIFILFNTSVICNKVNGGRAIAQHYDIEWLLKLSTMLLCSVESHTQACIRYTLIHTHTQPDAGPSGKRHCSATLHLVYLVSMVTVMPDLQKCALPSIYLGLANLRSAHNWSFFLLLQNQIVPSSRN